MRAIKLNQPLAESRRVSTRSRYRLLQAFGCRRCSPRASWAGLCRVLSHDHRSLDLRLLLHRDDADLRRRSAAPEASGGAGRLAARVLAVLPDMLRFTTRPAHGAHGVLIALMRNCRCWIFGWARVGALGFIAAGACAGAGLAEWAPGRHDLPLVRRCRGLTKKYLGLTAVDDVSLPEVEGWHRSSV